MKKFVLIVAVLVLISAIAYVYLRNTNRRTDIIGVTTLYETNTVYMNSKPGKDFYAGSGELSVSGGKYIHVEYALESGNFDLAFRLYHEGREGLDVQKAELDKLPASGDLFGKSGVSGKGSLDFEVASGKYNVYFKSHGAIGSATVTVKAH
ncbi:MAG: hypothetical protein J5846_06850 [Desulfovibrio sp.]|nr:hypothetical protein [Desulfovibrio sp.]